MQVVTIQYARAVAALMVVVFHLRPQLERMGHDLSGVDWLASGVDVFFVISGFIMWWTTRDADQTPSAFVRRRLLRIVPLYWAVTTFYVFVLFFAPHLMQTGALDPYHAVSSYFFLPYPHPVLGDLQPLVTPGWTLNFEMFFYLVFAAMLLVARSRRIAALAAVLIGLVLLGRLIQSDNRFVVTYTSTLLLEFLLGVVVAELVLRRKLPPASLALPIAAIGFLGLPLLSPLAEPATRGLVWGPPAALFIYGLVAAEAQGRVFRSGVLLFLGNASYSIYLSHQMTLSAAGQAWRRLIDASSTSGFVGFCVTGFVAATIVGCLCYLLVERPANAFARRLFPAGPARTPTTAPAVLGRRER
jgi:peptidoglycan/LPS O-acetylase OafA/YrhL